jgi:hypothetical protein
MHFHTGEHAEYGVAILNFPHYYDIQTIIGRIEIVDQGTELKITCRQAWKPHVQQTVVSRSQPIRDGR